METRTKILQAIYQSLCVHGYRGTNINEVVLGLGMTKGALYYHFRGGKKELISVVIEEILRPDYLRPWDSLNRKKTHPIRFLALQVQTARENRPGPSALYQLLQELTGQEEELRLQLAEIIQDLHESMVAALKRGIKNGTVIAKVNARQEAWYFLSAYEGALSLGYALQDPKVSQRSLNALLQHLATLEARNRNL